MRLRHDGYNADLSRPLSISLKSVFGSTFFITAALFWTLAVIGSCAWCIYSIKQATIQLCLVEAKSDFNKDLLYRRWAAGHGGVYVSETKETPPNPYLAHVKERDITTPSGKKLTLVNPAYMTRQVHEIDQDLYHVKGHITSLKPIRPKNAPDAWETAALKSFEKGATEVHSIEKIGGKPYLRFMGRMVTEKPCLKCHAAQGYKEGEVRGGISVSVPMDSYFAIEKKNLTPVLLGNIFVWLLGISAMTASAFFMRHRINDLNEAANKLQLSEEKFRNLFETAMDGIMIADVETKRFMYANPAARALLGYKEAELREMIIADIHPKDALEFITEEFEAQARGEKNLIQNIPCLRKDGSIFFADIHSNATLIDGRKCNIGFFRDVTERMRAENEIREFSDALKTSQIIGGLGSYVFDIRGNAWTSSEVLDDIFGIDEAFERTAESWLTLVHPEWREIMWKHLMEEVVAQGQQFDREYMIVRNADGVERWVHGMGRLEMDSEGSPIRMIGTIQDITDRKQDEKEKEKLQQQLLQAQKMDSVGQLAGGIAHDFNNMLAIILGSAQLARDVIPPSSDILEEIDAIIDASKRSRDLVAKLLLFSRKDTAKLEAAPVKDIITAVTGMLKRTLNKNIEIREIISGDIILKCDANQIHQALLNICNNAVDAMPRGGTITIECSKQRFPNNICGTCGEELLDAYCVIQISDMGVGMSKELAQKVVEPFFTTKGIGKGTGLGLSVTHGIVKGHNGHLHIYSEINKGTCIKLYLPLSDIDCLDKLHANVINMPTGNETILVCDDEESLLAMAGKMLKKLGYTPILCKSGPEAIETFKEFKDDIPLIILDIMMPEMDGTELFGRIRELKPNIKVIFSSGYSINGQAKQLFQHGIHKFVQKPYSIEELSQAIREILDAAS